MVSELTWRRLSEQEKIEIEQKAKKVMFNFGKTLEKIPNIKEAFVERESFEREETEPWQNNPNFKKQILKNAPKSNDDCIIAERGSWVK
ncbi:MAG TPA: hypothetical protein P5277_00225 [Candidatus Paceibacterota bacterium]|nr:hypothetical protein [Candidatus Paceibacterota bacterium]